MATKQKSSLSMSIIHRYLGFFLAGIMTIYSISGIVLVFRDTDTFKKEIQIEKIIALDVKAADLGKKLKIKRLKVEKEEEGILYFKTGTYNSNTGIANYTTKELPYILDKMTHLHKATTDSPLYWLNIFFGLSLLFFVISTFWMFTPKTKTFKKGLYFTLGGIIMTLIILFL